MPKYYDKLINNRKRITLTFDDGPHKVHTSKILNILKNYDISATFFIVGENLAVKNLKVIEKIKKSGHEIGNHSFDHSKLTTLNKKQIESQISKTHKLLIKYFEKCDFFRPPYGASNQLVKSVIANYGYEEIMWNVDTLDWKDRNKKWVTNGISQINKRADSLVLLHDIHKSTAEHLELFIKKILLHKKTDFVSLKEFNNPVT